MAHTNRIVPWKSSVKSPSERFAGDWLEGRGLAPRYEVAYGLVKPEFSAYDQDDTLAAVVEVKDICWSPSEYALHLELLDRAERDGFSTQVRGSDPYKLLRRKIRDSFDQLSAVSAPTMLIVHDQTGMQPLGDPIAVWGSLLGDLTITIPVGPNGAGEAATVFGTGGRLTAPDWHEDYKALSAVAILQHKYVERHYTGFLAEMKRLAAAEALTSEGKMNPRFLYYANELERRFRRMGMDPERFEPCLEIYRNPWANREWPLEYVGPHDQMQDYDLSTSSTKTVYDGLAPGM